MLSKRSVFLLFICFFAVWFGTLSQRKLVRPDEGRYAEIGREMAVSGDWITPRLNGIKYFEKPALQYWATAASFELLGESEWTARLWPALTGYLCVLLVGYTGRRLFGREAGFYAAAVAGSSLLMVGMGHMNTVDMGMTFFLQVAVSAFLFAQQRGSPAAPRKWMLVAWVALALAVLSKGIVALVLTGGTLVLYCLLHRNFTPLRRMEWRRGLALFLLVAAPWFVAVSVVNPEFPRFFFIHEHFERFLTKVHGRYQPWWYFIPIFLAGGLPWTTMLPSAFRASGDLRTDEFRPGRFLSIWVVVVFVFFSLSDSKLPSYILPLFPPLALLVGVWLTRARSRAIVVHLAIAAGLAGLSLAVILAASYRRGLLPDQEIGAYIPWLIAAGMALLGGSSLGLAFLKNDRRSPAIAAVAGGAIVAWMLAILGHDVFNRSSSGYWMASQARPYLGQNATLYSVGTFDHTLPFYLKRTLTLVKYRDEFDFGLQQEPRLGIPTIKEFETRWRQDKAPFALLLPDLYDNLRAAGLPMEIIARDERRVFVRRP